MKKIMLLGTLLLSACAGTPKAPEAFDKKIVETDNLNFITYQKQDINKKQPIRFYIAHNGNPNPKKLMALELAKKDKHPNIVVLTRPCQYIDNKKMCSNENIWGKDQYNTELVNELKEVIYYYLKEYKTSNIEFVAYDNAVPMAYLLADSFSNVKQIVTIAGILDIDVYSKRTDAVFNDVSRVKRAQAQTEKIKQIHFVGGKDKITSQQIASRFVSNFINPTSVQVRVAPNMDHDNWDKITLKY